MTSDLDEAMGPDSARGALMDVGAAALPRQPWQHRRQPPSDVDLVRFAAWAAREPEVDGNTLSAGLRLLESARAELDQIEAALLFAGRAAGLTWPELAAALGLRSAQAAQQRHDRVSTRVGEGDRR